MEQLYPLAGTTTSSCASQDYDFLNYWVDQTVEKEILRGKKLRELKTRPAVQNKKYDVINIGQTKVCSGRGRSPRSRKKGRKSNPKRNHSPIRKRSPVRKKDSKSSRQRCPMRIAELAVPSKRQCIDTWRNKYHVLPGIMIDRLRQQVMDLSPVVKIPDAIECFKIHKQAEKRKKKEAKQQKMKRDINSRDCKKKVKKPTKTQECRYLCAIFGHKIAKELNKPVQVTLNNELENISKVVSIEIDKLINNGKRINYKNKYNKSIHNEVAGKISIWIANILEDITYKILEDQLRDLEEEVGPVLDFIDDLVDNVVDICKPEPDVEVTSSSATYYIESSDDEANKEDESTADDKISVESGFQQDAEVIENLDDFIKNELDNIINLFDGDIATEVEDLTNADQKNKDEADLQTTADKEQNEFLDANDTFELLPSNELDSSETKEDPLLTDQQKGAESDKDTSIEILSEDDSNKKVKFSDINMVTSDHTAKKGAQVVSDSDPDQVFAAPNDHLLSNADESWPEDINPPLLRPSESVSKSITSLGKIMEAEERTSVMLDDDGNNKAKEIMKDADTIKGNETFEGLTDAEAQEKINGAVNIIAGSDGTDEPKGANENMNTDTDTNIDTIINARKVHGADYIYRPSTDSTFNHHVPTESVVYQQKLGKTLEEQATQVADLLAKKLEDEATQVKDNKILEDEATQANEDKKLEDEATQVKEERTLKDEATQETPKDTVNKVDIETADKQINTSFSLVPRADKSTSIASQSLGDIRSKRSKADNMFSSWRIKPRVDYKVNKQSAPSWVTQSFGEPQDSFITTPKQKEGNDQNIRLWCKDLENGFANLELWNGWIENTVESVKIREMKKARLCMDKSREQFVSDWLQLKKNVDADVQTWAKLSKSTQEKLKGFRKIYQNFEIPPPPETKICNCHT